MYKIETHLHTMEVSPCAHLPVEEIVEAYVKAGYDGICVTDHFHRKWFDLAKPRDILGAFLKGYEAMKKRCDEAGIKCYWGAEFRLDENKNDYLAYHVSEQVLKEGAAVFSMTLPEFSKYVRRMGTVLVQAHPMRDGCSPVSPRYLDAIEVYNATPRHEGYNQSVFEYAEKYQMVGTAGSDCHRPVEKARSGILSATLPEDNYAFAQLLRSGDFELIRVEGECWARR